MLMIHTLCPARPHWPWTLFMRMESFPIPAARAEQTYMNIQEKPRAYSNCRNAGHWLAPSRRQTHIT